MNSQSLQGNKLGELFSGLRLSPLEALALVAVLGFAGYVGYYFLWQVKPLNDEIVAVQNRMMTLQNQVKADKDRATKLEKQRADAERIVRSRDVFEAHLQRGETGKAALIDGFDALAKKHKIMTGDFGFKPIEEQPLVDENGQLLKEALRSSRLNVYPALGIETLVIGDYPSLRRFLADLERSNQFVIVNALTFQGEAEKRLNAVKNQADKLAPNPVSLKIEMDTYFKKEGR